LLGLDGNSALADVEQSNDQLHVNGSVAAGVWRESEHWNDERRFVIHLPSPFPNAKRFGVVVEGLSMNQVYEPGSVLDCISIFADGVKPSNGDHVIVERTRPDGLRELTVKEYQEDGGRYLLVPRSTRPEFVTIEYPGPDRAGEPDPSSGELVQVIAFVVTAYPPRSLGLMRRMGVLEDVCEGEVDDR
jgi:SOS-response transcriptional repressor LexA